MRILVVGAGATGGYFGGRLAQAGRDVTFLLRPARAAQIRANGMQIVSPHGDVTLHPKILTAPQITEPFDMVLLTVKAFALEAALADLAPAVGAQTMILPTLNGMKHLDAMSTRFGVSSVIGCVCKIAATVDDAGRIVQLATMHELAYGERNGTSTARIAAVDAALQGAGFDARLTPDIERELWEKWILLASLGGVNCLMRGNIGEIAAAAGGVAFALGFLAECVAIATRSGTAPGEPFVANARKMLTATGSPLTSSMYRDLTGGKPVEADQIIGDLLARGAAAGVSAPLLAAAYANLCVYQNRL
jgi:2-dehydropantoate 2-reductase